MKKQQQEAELKKLTKASSSAVASTPPIPPSTEDDNAVVELSEDGSFDISSGTENTKQKSEHSESVPDDKKADDKEDDEEEEDNTPARKNYSPYHKYMMSSSRWSICIFLLIVIQTAVGNGGTTDNYVWTQTLSELNVIFTVPLGTKSKMIDVEIKNQHLRVGLKGQEPIVNAPLHKRVIVDDSFWTLEDNRDVAINLQKDNKMEWWKCVIEGDPEINTSKVQPENSKLGDLDGETRQTVEKM